MIVVIKWTEDGNEYSIGILELFKLLGIKLTEEDVKQAVGKALINK